MTKIRREKNERVSERKSEGEGWEEREREMTEGGWKERDNEEKRNEVFSHYVTTCIVLYM